MAAIITSLWKLAENLGLSIKKDTIEEQINAMNKALEVNQENNIANALWNYADASGGGGEGFKVFIGSASSDNNLMFDQMFVDNDSDSIDITALQTDYGSHPLIPITVKNPVSELRYDTLSMTHSGYKALFIPKSGCKYYEGDTEIDPNDIYVPRTYPGGQTSYVADGTRVYYITSTWSPYGSPTRELNDIEDG